MNVRTSLKSLSTAFLTVALVSVSGWLSPASAVTGDDLTNRITIDGNSTDFEEDESVFGTTTRDLNEDGTFEDVPEERFNDSKWGFNNDVNQIKVTWDAENLYVAVDGISWDNNIILLFDYLPGGLDKMTELNSWRRNFTFSNGFFPDLFFATWDGNTTPQIWRHTGAENTVVQIDVTLFETVASFSQGATGRSMEARIPWTVVYENGLEKAWNEEAGESTYVLPTGLGEGRPMRVCAVLTAGGDGTGGPDSAPDNFGGHTISSSDDVALDNFAVFPFDTTYYVTNTDTQIYSVDELPDGETIVDTIAADGMPDLLGVHVKNRITFLGDPPILGISFAIDKIVLDRPILSPEEGDILEFQMKLDPDVREENRNVVFLAEVYDMEGRRVIELISRELSTVEVPDIVGTWDGRGMSGDFVPGGIYLLRVKVFPGAGSLSKAFSVVR